MAQCILFQSFQQVEEKMNFLLSEDEAHRITNKTAGL